jgi:hypothetical protein
LKDDAFHMKDVRCGGWWACERLGFARVPLCGKFALGLLTLGLALGAGSAAAQTGVGTGSGTGALTPESNSKTKKPPQPLDPCDLKNSGASMVTTGGLRAVAVLGVGETTRTAGSSAAESKVCNRFKAINWYDRFVTGPDVMRFSPEQKFRLAVTNIINPFNLGTIVGEAGFEVAINSHTPYGPGIGGWAKLSGTNLTQDMTDQFFGTFLIPSITHTDPHYHRRPDLSIPRRIWHCVDQIVWQRDDSGGHTLNYSQILAPVIDISISNLYVPGLQTNFGADAERYGVGLATAPIDNFITEFVPSIASHIHTHVVFVQRVINQVAVNPP